MAILSGLRMCRCGHRRRRHHHDRFGTIKREVCQDLMCKCLSFKQGRP